MTAPPLGGGAHREGSRYLYAPFEVAEARIEANERVALERWAAVDHRLTRIEDGLERLERRLWLAVWAIAAVVISEGVASLLASLP